MFWINFNDSISVEEIVNLLKPNYLFSGFGCSSYILFFAAVYLNIPKSIITISVATVPTFLCHSATVSTLLCHFATVPSFVCHSATFQVPSWLCDFATFQAPVCCPNFLTIGIQSVLPLIGCATCFVLANSYCSKLIFK
ncbi:hypothetical protein J6590_031590 [Homalodisca vitripennis]|nr:hypothetical protein J6590_031590 [Homalodisca vitripennis]